MNDAPSIAFLFTPGGQKPEFQHHLGIAYAQAYMKQFDLPSIQVIPRAGCNYDECLEALEATNAPVIGFPVFDNNFYLVRKLASRIKEQHPDKLVLAGGPAATFSDELILKQSPGIDLCVRFEGEETLTELLPTLIKHGLNGAISQIQGVSFRRNGSIVRTPNRPLHGLNRSVEDALDDIPSPYLTGILNGTEGAGILTARGCVHHCTYCNFSAMSRHTIRYHSVERVIAELKHFKETLLRHPEMRPDRKLISIHDDAFTLNAARAKKICRRIIEEELRLSLTCLCRADNIDAELVELLKAAGFADISFGLESAVPRVLRNIKKVTNRPPRIKGETYAPEKRYLKKVENCVDLAKKEGIRVSFSIILGLPGETREEGLQTMAYVKRLGGHVFMQNYLMAFSGTEVFDTAANYGIQIKASEYGLPYRTIHAYPVESIPLGENSSFLRISKGHARDILRMIGGSKPNGRHVAKGVDSAIVFFDSKQPFEGIADWLSENLSICGKYVVIGDAESDSNDYQQVIEHSARAGIPTRELFFFRKIISDNGTYQLRPISKNATWWPFTFPFQRFSDLMKNPEKIRTTDSTIWKVYEIQRNSDVDEISDYAEFVDSHDMSLILDGVVAAGCRWNSSRCPAVDLHRVVIDSNGSIRPCMEGPVLGDISEEIKTLRQRAKTLLQEAYQQRNCTTCEMEQSCSICLRTDETRNRNSHFCQIRKNRPSITKMVTSSNLLHTYHPADF